ncbi:MAG: hypothetical protein N3A01_01885 [Bacteroidales bacterium]|nr:hypothetical protein [Bacteroidales bacterium]
MRIAVIDLGTNTFNILISDAYNGSFVSIYSKKTGVRLIKGEGCSGIITTEAFNRALETIKIYKEKINYYNVDIIKPIATAAFRDTKNASLLISEIERILNTKIEVIDGLKEASYIYEGVKHAVHLNSNPVVIVDIGGGSVELIIANDKKILWANSYKIGVSRIIEKFKVSDPLTPKEIMDLSNFIDNELTEFREEVSKYKVNTLIGSSGSFDCFANILSYQIFNKPIDNSAKSNELNIMKFNKLLSTLIISSYEQRKQIRGIDDIRIELIHISSLIVSVILSYFKCIKLIHSNYAIKEGIIFSLLNN